MTDINRDFLNQLYTQSGADNLLDTMSDTPTPYKPLVTQQDAEQGFITRYFVRAVTDKDYVVEVNLDDYSRLRENPRFVTAQVRWKIVGIKETITSASGVKNLGVNDYNILEVSMVDLTFGGLKRYIRNYLDFWLAETI
jgi:hypothetical protein